MVLIEVNGTIHSLDHKPIDVTIFAGCRPIKDQVFLIFAQLLLPIVAVAWLAFEPTVNRLELAVQAFAVQSLAAALRLAGLWTVMSWWLPYTNPALGGAVVLRAARRRAQPA